jgi:threonine synthase
MSPSTSLRTSGWKGIIEAYRAYLPVTSKTPVITLLEGNTPLIPAAKLAAKVGKDCNVYIKYEGLNPTGSFKDRGMTVALSLAIERGARHIICASTGNTSASAAAYSARAGVKCVVLLPFGNVAKGKLAQAMMYGACCVTVDGNFDDALKLVREVGKDKSYAIVNSINPDRLEGQKTAAFEVIEALGDAPDFHFIPVGNAGNITAYWRGYCEWHGIRRCKKKPRMFGFEAEGAAPIVQNRIIEKPSTVATAIQIGNPASWKAAVEARDASGGAILTVTDDEILAAQSWLACNEGIFIEPASAASIAGLWKVAASKPGIPAGSTVVCTVTGNGLKDPDTAIAHSREPVHCPARLEAVLDAIHAA